MNRMFLTGIGCLPTLLSRLVVALCAIVAHIAALCAQSAAPKQRHSEYICEARQDRQWQSTRNKQQANAAAIKPYLPTTALPKAPAPQPAARASSVPATAAKGNARTPFIKPPAATKAQGWASLYAVHLKMLPTARHSV